MTLETQLPPCSILLLAGGRGDGIGVDGGFGIGCGVVAGWRARGGPSAPTHMESAIPRAPKDRRQGCGAELPCIGAVSA